MASFLGGQVCFMLLPALAWHVDSEMARAFAVGLFLINVVHLATIRTVHFPLAMMTLTTATLIAVVSNAVYWVAVGDWPGLGISSVAVIAAGYFVQITTTSVHALHREMAENQRAAELANSAKTRFLAQMSHELRTPLNAILGMGYAEMANADPGQRQERLATMVQSARSLSLLLDDILDMSAAQAGQMPIRPADVDLGQVIRASLALFGQQLSDAGQTLSLTLAEGVPERVRLDGQRLRQCLSNIVANATKYAGPGTIEVNVALAGPGLLAIEVKDTGPGVPVGLEESIFEPFQRGDESVAGTGLGLSISRTLARRMGGDLVLKSRTQGAHFRLTLRFEPASPQPARDDAPSLVDLRGRRVLVVDDIATNRLVAMSYLRIMGAEATEAASCDEALAHLAKARPDAVLLDMLMPGRDGLATLAAIRALDQDAGHLPVIAMTADVTDEGRRRYLAAGVDGYVAKPVSPEGLSASLRAVLAPRLG